MNVTVSLTTEEDKNNPNIPAFDYTKLSALNTCPRWGLIRYDQHKRMPGEGRNLPLEMGACAHDGFAAVRLFELFEYGRAVYGRKLSKKLLDTTGERLFGKVRYATLRDIITSNDDARRRVCATAIHAVNTQGYYDDPSDKRRTLSNLESSIVAYIDRLELGRRVPYVNGEFVGIEVTFDITLTFDPVGVHVDQTGYHLSGPVKIRYIGRIDGIMLEIDGRKIEPEENKTASRLNDAWINSFIMSHQVTGYCVALATILGKPLEEGASATVRGMMIPLPKTYDLGGIAEVPVDRDQYRYREWFNWIWHTYTTQYLPYKDNPLYAPEYTNSCNRYFKSCSFIPLCAMAEPAERELSFSQMVHDKWDPLAQTYEGE